MLGRTSAPALIATAAATLGLFAMVATGAQAASKPPVKAKTVTACVNKKSGATKVLLGSKAKKKCAKGWSKVTWSVAGKDGANGSNGTNGAAGKNAVGLQVRDSAGTVLGTYVAMISFDLFPIYQVVASDGGLYNYLADGELLPSTNPGSVLFQDPECEGTAYGNVGSLPSSVLRRFLGPTRLVHRSGSFGAFGTPRVWKFTSATVTVPEVVPTFYNLDRNGTCLVSTGADTPLPVEGNALITLASTPAPPDGVGNLTVS